MSALHRQTAVVGSPIDDAQGAETSASFGLGPISVVDGGAAWMRSLMPVNWRALRGRWLCLRLAASASGRLAVRLVSPTGHWHAAAVDIPVGPEPVDSWLFIGPQLSGLRLEGDPSLLAGLELVGAHSRGQLPETASAAQAMRTVAALHAFGISHLDGLTVTDDGAWPLRATGGPVVLGFEPPPIRGHYSLRAALRTKGEPLAPSLKLLRRGRHALAPQLKQQSDGDLHAEMRLDTSVLRCRFDLGALQAGTPLRLADWQLRPRNATALARVGSRVAAWAGKMRCYWSVNALYAEHEIEPVLAGAPNEFRVTGGEPRLRLTGQVPSGWYMLRVQCRFDTAMSEARILGLDGPGEDEPGRRAGRLPLRSGRMTKRLLHLERPATLGLSPLQAPGAVTVESFALVRVPFAAVRSRVQRKLAALHPRYRGRDAAGLGSVDFEALWHDYNELFDRRGDELVSYAEWIARVEARRLPTADEQGKAAAGWSWQPRFSIVTPTYNTDAAHLAACLDSVLGQTYPHWELCIADDASTLPHVRATIEAYAAREPRIRVAWRTKNGHIVAASNTALHLARGDFIVLLDHDDMLAPHALFSVAKALQARPTAQLIYSDEDKLDQNGERRDPYFKPDFSPDLLRSQNYFSHLGVYRRELVEAVGGFRAGFEGSQDYDLVLRCVARVEPADVLHVPEVLYHWRMSEGSTSLGHDRKDYASEAGRRALQESFDAVNAAVEVSITAPGIYRHRWPLPSPPPLVSLIVPTRDGYDVLCQCIDSILHRTDYPHFEILLVDNQSSCERTLAYFAGLAAEPRVRLLHYDHPFNYSAINNFAATQARGSVLGLINNDIEVITPDWLSEMVRHAARPDIGCVGAKLYYPNGTIQHGGVVVGMGGIADHVFRHLPRESPGYFGRLWLIHNLSAVTAAALLVRKSVFDQVGGLDEQGLPVAFNDVDLCLKVVAAGYRNLWTPFAELYHHESISRGADTTPEKRSRFVAECEVMYQRWGTLLEHDPYYNPNLALRGDGYTLSLAESAASELE